MAFHCTIQISIILEATVALSRLASPSPEHNFSNARAFVKIGYDLSQNQKNCIGF
jgi:hypothetical protein